MGAGKNLPISAETQSVQSWFTDTAYRKDAEVIRAAVLYTCDVAHTSGTFATDLAAAKWLVVGPASVPGIDATAIHDDTAGEINAVAEKVTPVGTDLIIVEDSADSNNKKKVQLANLPGLAEVEDPQEAHISFIGRTSGDGTRASQSTFDGATWLCSKAATIDTMHVRVTSNGVDSDGHFAIYQQADGNTGDATLLASSTGVDVSSPSGNKVVTFTPFALVPGFVYILWGKSAGANWTGRTFSTNAQDLENVNLPTGIIPTTFTTTISATVAAPATFDPKESIISLGDAVPAGSTNTALIVRLIQ